MIVIHNIHISMYICMHMSSCMCICVTPLATHPPWYGMLFSDVWSYTSVSSWISSEFSYLPILLLYPSSSQWHDRVPELELELNSNCPASPGKKKQVPFPNWTRTDPSPSQPLPLSSPCHAGAQGFYGHLQGHRGSNKTGDHILGSY